MTTLFSKIFCFSDFFSGTGQDGTDGTDRQTDRQTNRHMDRQTFLGKYYFRCRKSFIIMFHGSAIFSLYYELLSQTKKLKGLVFSNTYHASGNIYNGVE